MSDGDSPFNRGRFYYSRLDDGLADGDPESPVSPRQGSRRSRLIDRLIGILLGLLIGVAIVIGFVFWGSEETIDAPRIDPGTTPAREAPAR